MLLESPIRDMAGAGWVTGNRVVLDLRGGVYARYAHLRRRSLQVRVGDRVYEGWVLGQCGNSGNSTEPHVHFQLTDAADPNVAWGLPFRWRGAGLPRSGDAFTAEPAAAGPAAG